MENHNKKHLSSFQDMTLLYVEDDMITQKLLSRFFEVRFKTVLCAKDGEEGLSVFSENSHAINLVVTDIVMPKINGLEMGEELRKRGFLGPIIITSAYIEPFYQKKAGEIGISGYLQKPIMMQEFAMLLEKILKEDKA